MSSPLELLIETDTVRVYEQAGRADAGEVWVTFQGLRLDMAMGAGALRRRGVPAFHFVARRDEWYLGDDAAAAVKRVGARLAAHGGRVIVLGASMGGFAALLYARVLGAQLVIAAGPQVVVDRRDTRGVDERYDREWQALAARGLGGNAAGAIDPATRLVIIYDPFERADAWHAALLRTLPGASFRQLPFVGHEVLVELARSGLWPEALAAAADGPEARWAAIRSAFWASRRERFFYHFTLGEWFLRKGRLAPAPRCFRAAIARRPEFLPTYALLSIAFERQGDTGAAIDALWEGVERLDGDDRFWWFFQRIGNLHRAAGELDAAEAALIEATRLLPQSADVHAELGRFRLWNRPSLSGRAGAARALRRAIALRPEEPDLRRRLGEAQGARAARIVARWPRIAAVVLQSTAAEPTDGADLYLGLSLALGRQGDERGAIAAAERALSLVRESDHRWWMYGHLADLHARAGDAELAETVRLRAATALAAAIRKDPDRPGPWADYGRFLVAHQPERAVQASRALRRARALGSREPEDVEALALAELGRAARLARRRPVLARSAVAAARSHLPRTVDAFNLLSLALERCGDRDAAIAALNDGIACIGDDDRYWWMYQRLAGLLVDAGDLDAAEDALVTATARFPIPSALAELGRFRLRHRSTRTARASAARLFRRAARLARGNASYADLIAEVTLARASALAQRFPALARPLLEDAARLLPNSIDARNSLGIVLERLGDRGGAIQQMEMAVPLIGRDERYWWVFQTLAGLHYRYGDVSGGVAVLRRAIAHFPLLPETHAELAKILTWFGRREQGAEAARALRRAARLRPDSDFFRSFAIDIALKRAIRIARRRPRASLRAIETIRAAHPDRIDLCHALSYPLEALGRLNAARAAVERGIALIPPDYDAEPEGFWWMYDRLAQVHILAGDLDAAETAYVEALRRHPMSSYAQGALRGFRVRHRGARPEGANALGAHPRLMLGLDLLIDANWYAAGIGTSLFGEDPRTHYLDGGSAASGSPHPLFDAHHYRAQGPDWLDERLTPLGHFILAGWAQGLDPHPLFDTRFYLRQAGADAGLDPLSHYLLFGARAGLDPHPRFATRWYLARNPDVAASCENPLVQYVRLGAAQGRAPHPELAAPLPV